MGNCARIEISKKYRHATLRTRARQLARDQLHLVGHEKNGTSTYFHIKRIVILQTPTIDDILRESSMFVHCFVLKLWAQVQNLCDNWPLTLVHALFSLKVHTIYYEMYLRRAFFL